MSTDRSESPAAASNDRAAAPRRSGKTLLWTSTTNFGEGLPWSFLHQMGTEFLTAIGASKTQISSTSLLHLAVTFKFAWSPVVDLFGKKRTWVWALQVLLAAGMCAVAAVAPSRNLAWFWVVVAMLSVVHATHDIACDGFYIQALDTREQALYSGARIAAYRAAMLVGSSVLVYLAGRISWLVGFGAGGALMLVVALVNAAVMPRPRVPASVAAADGGAGNDGRVVDRVRKGAAFWAAYRTFFTQPQAALVLSFMLFYKLGDIMMFAMSKPLLRDIGVDTQHRALLNGIGTAGTILGSIVGGALIARAGIARCLVPMTYFQNLSIPLYIAMAIVRPHFAAIAPIIFVEQVAAGVGAAAHVVYLMQRCRSAFSASHFAFATALVALGSTLSGFVSGPLNEWLGHPWFFTVAFVASIPSLILVLVVPKTAIESASIAP